MDYHNAKVIPGKSNIIMMRQLQASYFKINCWDKPGPLHILMKVHTSDPKVKEALTMFASYSIAHPNMDNHEFKFTGDGKWIFHTSAYDSTFFSEDNLYIGLLAM